MVKNEVIPMSTIPSKILAFLDSSDDYLAKGVDVTEYRKTVRRAARIFHQSEAHNFKSVAYAWRSGQEFLRIKRMVRRGNFTAWKKGCGFASPRKIEMYMTIARGFETEEVASIAAPNIVAVNDVIKKRKTKV